MTEKFTVEDLLRNLDDAIAVVAVEGWEVLYENAKFFQWFSNQGDDEANTEDESFPGIIGLFKGAKQVFTRCHRKRVCGDCTVLRFGRSRDGSRCAHSASDM